MGLTPLEPKLNDSQPKALGEFWVVEVVFDLKLFNPLTYCIDTSITNHNALKPNDLVGHLVLAPVRKSLKLGVIVGFESRGFSGQEEVKDRFGFEVKAVEQLISPKPVMSEDHLNWLEKTASFFHQPLGQMAFLSLHPPQSAAIAHQKPPHLWLGRYQNAK